MTSSSSEIAIAPPSVALLALVMTKLVKETVLVPAPLTLNNLPAVAPSMVVPNVLVAVVMVPAKVRLLSTVIVAAGVNVSAQSEIISPSEAAVTAALIVVWSAPALQTVSVAAITGLTKLPEITRKLNTPKVRITQRETARVG